MGLSSAEQRIYNLHGSRGLNEYRRRRSLGETEDFLLSLMLADTSGSFLEGALLGGNVEGALLGEMLHNDSTEDQTVPDDDNSPPDDNSGFDDDKRDSGDWSSDGDSSSDSGGDWSSDDNSVFDDDKRDSGDW